MCIYFDTKFKWNWLEKKFAKYLNEWVITPKEFKCCISNQQIPTWILMDENTVNTLRWMRILCFNRPYSKFECISLHGLVRNLNGGDWSCQNLRQNPQHCFSERNAWQAYWSIRTKVCANCTSTKRKSVWNINGTNENCVETLRLMKKVHRNLHNFLY
jgi:hypothetical protein